MPIKNDRQYRAMPLLTSAQEKRFETEFYIEGYAAKYEPYFFYESDEGPVYERFERGAFSKADMADIIFQYNHKGRVFARQSNNTLKVELDDTGLFIAADLSKTAQGRDLFNDIDTGMITKMSWGFFPGDYYFDKEERTIVHTSVKKIFDVSAVSMPANNDTEIYARQFADGAIEQMRKEIAERKRKQLRIMMMLED